MTWSPCLIGAADPSGAVRYELGHPLVDRYQAFVAGRARPHTVCSGSAVMTGCLRRGSMRSPCPEPTRSNARPQATPGGRSPALRDTRGSRSLGAILRSDATTRWLGAVRGTARALVPRPAPTRAVARRPPAASLAAPSLLVKPVLAWAKKRTAAQLGSPTLRADATETLLCTWLPVTLLVGLVLNATVSWRWADPVAALVIAGTEDHPESWQGADDLGVRVLVKTVGQLGLEGGDLSGELAGDGDEGTDDRAHRLAQQIRGGELRGPQRCLDLGGSLLGAPLPAAAPQRRRDLGAGQMAAQRRGRSDGEHGQGVAVAQLPEGLEGVGVELAQGRAELVELPLAGPDQALVGPGEDLDRLDQLAVTGNGSVVVMIGAGQFRQHPGITRIGLRPRGRVPLPIARHRQRVDSHPVDRAQRLARRRSRGGRSRGGRCDGRHRGPAHRSRARSAPPAHFPCIKRDLDDRPSPLRDTGGRRVQHRHGRPAPRRSWARASRTGSGTNGSWCR
jgi:hypothetical protein